MISSDFPRRFSPSLARIWLHIILRSVAAAAAAAVIILAAANVAAISLAAIIPFIPLSLSLSLFAASDVTAQQG